MQQQDELHGGNVVENYSTNLRLSELRTHLPGLQSHTRSSYLMHKKSSFSLQVIDTLRVNPFAPAASINSNDHVLDDRTYMSKAETINLETKTRKQSKATEDLQSASAATLSAEEVCRDSSRSVSEDIEPLLQKVLSKLNSSLDSSTEAFDRAKQHWIDVLETQRMILDFRAITVVDGPEDPEIGFFS